jgi:hypothetical protein
MFARFRPRLSYANVVASLALFVALGGGALAAGLVGSDGKIKSCVAKSNGAVRVVGPDSSCHTKRERTLSWNLRGVPGIAGKDGKDGVDATPADFAGEATHEVAAADPNVGDAAGNGCDVGRFCANTGNASWWRNYGQGYAPVGYWRDKTGIVHLEGIADPNGPSPTGIFFLPEGYRPSTTREFTVRLCTGILGYVDIEPSGRVHPSDRSKCVPFDGINFRP